MEGGVEASSGLSVSHETIYQAIHALPRGELKKELLTCFRQDKPHRASLEVWRVRVAAPSSVSANHSVSIS